MALVPGPALQRSIDLGGGTINVDNNVTTVTKPAIRYRVNVATSVKGVKTFDATVELMGPIDAVALADILRESDRLVKELDQRYPAQGG